MSRDKFFEVLAKKERYISNAEWTFALSYVNA